MCWSIACRRIWRRCGASFPKPKPIDTPPFDAVQFFPIARKSMGSTSELYGAGRGSRDRAARLGDPTAGHELPQGGAYP
jgi:hypothetical protein